MTRARYRRKHRPTGKSFRAQRENEHGNIKRKLNITFRCSPNFPLLMYGQHLHSRIADGTLHRPYIFISRECFDGALFALLCLCPFVVFPRKCGPSAANIFPAEQRQTPKLNLNFVKHFLLLQYICRFRRLASCATAARCAARVRHNSTRERVDCESVHAKKCDDCLARINEIFFAYFMANRHRMHRTL